MAKILSPEYYVYALFRPDTGTVFYIGMGKGDRAWQHVGESRRHRSYKDNLIRKLIDVRGYPEIPVVILRGGLTRDEAINLEIIMIAALGRYPNGPLTNRTAGGDGGRIFLNEEDEKIKREKHSAATKGRPKDEDHKRKIGDAHRGRSKPEHVLKALADGYAAMDKMSPEWRAKQAARTKGKTQSADHKNKRAASLKGRRPSPQCIEAVRQANKRRAGVPRKSRKPHTQETKDKISASLKARNREQISKDDEVDK
jgi:hypothetical protein